MVVFLIGEQITLDSTANYVGLLITELKVETILLD